MNRIRIRMLVVTTLVLISLGSQGTFGTAVPVTLSVQPGSSSIIAGSSETLDINVTNVTNLFGFQFDLSFGPGILSAVSITEGSFLPGGGPTFFLPGDIDNGAGTIAFTADTLLGPVPSVNGSGTLAVLTVTGLGKGTSAISLSNVFLLDSSLDLIPSNILNANLKVTPTAVTPEPATMLLYATGLAVVGLRRRKQINSPIAR
jgi:Cohesin domain/PEP-CTERM motif